MIDEVVLRAFVDNPINNNEIDSLVSKLGG
jgi:hypothetical protein